MDCDAQSLRVEPDATPIPDLRSVPLERLADRAADAGDPVGRVVQQFVDAMDSPSRVPVTMFNSAI